jgi:hypothetical protein
MKQKPPICKMTFWSWIFMVQIPRLAFYTCRKRGSTKHKVEMIGWFEAIMTNKEQRSIKRSW